jgi:poly-gamma-glutamate synthesis protein (capsule biosynthesis protein)
MAVPDNITSTNLVFNFPPETISALHYLHVNAASQANNHSANAGAKGLANTRAVLTEANIQPFGGPGDDGIDKVASFEGQNMTLKVIGVHTLSSLPDLAPLIKELKADPKNRVLVFPHWGVEYIPGHTAYQASQAHAWIDAGADIVIGAHPHVIEDSELYKGKPILYSLGNFLFDQSFSVETQQGLFIAGEFTDQGLTLFGLPIVDKKYKPEFMRGTAKQAILDKIYAPFADYKKETPAGAVLQFPLP